MQAHVVPPAALRPVPVSFTRIVSRSRAALLSLPAAAVAAGYIVCVIWLRTGWVPAPSGGDEVWWSEAGWQFLQDGVLRWACFDDDRGSAILSFWPPVAPLLQAAMIWIFGLTPFGVMVQSSLVCTGIIVLLYALGRTSGLPRATALWVTVAAFGIFIVERRLLQVRMENLTALFGLGALLLLIRGQGVRSACGAGLMLGAGLFCYYPQSPFLLLGGLAVVLLVPGPVRYARLGALLLGLVPAVVAGALWIGPHADLFRRQVLEVGTSHYLNPGNLARPFFELFSAPSGLTWWQNLERCGALLVGIVAWRRTRDRNVRAIAAMCMASSLALFVYERPPLVLAGVLAGLLVFLLAANSSPGRVRQSLLGLASLLVLAAIAKFTLIGVTAWVQREGRDYRAISSDLTTLISPRCRTAVSQQAWLALRAHLPASHLHVLPYAPPSTENRPLIARSEAAAEAFDCLVLQRDRLPALRKVYPWLGPALDTGRFRVVANLSPTHAPLPWAGSRNYDLIVYFRTGVEPRP